MQEFAVRPDPDDPRLTRRVAGIDQDGNRIETSVVTERPLALFLNGREIVTMMTIGDHPHYLAVGYLLNQNMLSPADRIVAIDRGQRNRGERPIPRSASVVPVSTAAAPARKVAIVIAVPVVIVNNHTAWPRPIAVEKHLPLVASLHP